MTIPIFANSVGWNDEHAEACTPQVGAVDLRADPGQARQHQQREAAGRDQVAVLLQLAVVAQEDDRRDEQHQPGDEPLRLLARERRRRCGRSSRARSTPAPRRAGTGTGPRTGSAMRRKTCAARHSAEEDRPVRQRRGRDRAARERLLDEDRGEARGHQQRGRDQAEQLAVARAHPSSWPSSSCATGRARRRASAAVVEQRSRRAGGSCAAGTPVT